MPFERVGFSCICSIDPLTGTYLGSAVRGPLVMESEFPVDITTATFI